MFCECYFSVYKCHDLMLSTSKYLRLRLNKSYVNLLLFNVFFKFFLNNEGILLEPYKCTKFQVNSDSSYENKLFTSLTFKSQYIIYYINNVLLKYVFNEKFEIVPKCIYFIFVNF